MMLQIKMYLLVAALFGIIYALVSVVGAAMGIGNFLFYGILATAMMLAQYMLGPKMVEWSMGVKYVSEKERPELHEMVGELAKKAGIPKPRVGIAKTKLPNAFAFGRWASDSRVCVTEGVLDLLDKKELRAVLGHEIAHIKNRDVLVITMISVIPTIAWYIAWSTMFSGGRERGNTAAIGIAAFAIYFLTNLLVLYASRIREYYADRGSVKYGNDPHLLASALYKLVYGSAKTPKQELKRVEGMKAFFANDPSRAVRELSDLAEIDADKSGHIDEKELKALQCAKIRVSGADRFMELLSTHPNMVKRIQALAKMGS
ncbi:MAG: M48 family metalloprotease [Nanoarchaeota archaeon]|nr:M48 family metalloprotease [Nanoarchaeota archaeon]